MIQTIPHRTKKTSLASIDFGNGMAGKELANNITGMKAAQTIQYNMRLRLYSSQAAS
jgi:hypothetical protein